ncbi:ABC transporter ATP-binding protein [Puniceicoccus vermicola]|uniref:ABC transporter ATP-binding protein n=1 Tax=Puniceicoccus vermicola TaxID=388746 RepID=A0A7X1E3L7_9BACT|nr:ABC transporter ATP-binding protein [Puniceicoccus vermicola]MBC2601114.1 ABC transporter ATP-binding protein [Puniceicoccus vermicola]
MSDKDVVVSVRNLSKAYRVWRSPLDRLKSPFLGAVGRRFPRNSYFSRELQRRASRAYDDFYALQQVSFDIERGTSFGILGRNGSGKSTLLQIIAGTLTPSGGEVVTNGRVAALLELGSGFNPEFSGRENVYMNASILGISKKTIDERFDEIASFADIGDFMEQPVKTYSSGMYVRLAFSVIVHVDADVLIIDEALAVGDVFFVQKCMRFLKKFRERGVLLFVSHDLPSINRLCDQALWLDKGVVRQRGIPKDVTESYFSEYYSGGDSEKSDSEALKEAIGSGEEEKPVSQRKAPTESMQILGEEIHDQRLQYLNFSDHRNDIEVFAFRPDGDSFGAKRVEVVDARLTDIEGRRLGWIVGGEKVEARVVVEANETVQDPIIGFGLKDPSGQVLFGDNTFLTTKGQKSVLRKGQRLEAAFRFQMPILRPGEYVMNATVATGSQTDHEMQHWMHDACVLRSYTKSDTTGMIGIPMISIEIGPLR